MVTFFFFFILIKHRILVSWENYLKRKIYYNLIKNRPIIPPQNVLAGERKLFQFYIKYSIAIKAYFFFGNLLDTIYILTFSVSWYLVLQFGVVWLEISSVWSKTHQHNLINSHFVGFRNRIHWDIYGFLLTLLPQKTKQIITLQPVLPWKLRTSWNVFKYSSICLLTVSDWL